MWCLLPYGWATVSLDAQIYVCVSVCTLFKASSSGILSYIPLMLFLSVQTHENCCEERIHATHAGVKCVCEIFLGWSQEDTHNIRSKPCGVFCHRWWGMWHIEDKQAFPQTKIWEEPTFVFSTCLRNYQHCYCFPVNMNFSHVRGFFFFLPFL